MDEFCIGSMRTAKKKLYMPLSEGGLGLIKIHDFITSLQCAWVKRVSQHWGDNWRYDIKLKCYGNPLIVDGRTFERDENPILFYIGTSFGIFRAAFTQKDDNYKKALIFRNPFFRRGRRDDGILCETFFGTRNNYEQNKILATLKFEDFFVRRRPKSLNELLADYGLNLTLVTYMRLYEALQFTVNSRRDDEIKQSQSLEFFIKSFEKGSKPFRRILNYRESIGYNISTLNTVKTFSDLVGIEAEKNVLHSCWGEWQRHFYGNRCKEFLYKFRNNILGLNQRVANFVPGFEAECSLCVINNEPLPRNVESFMHLFFECNHSQKYRGKLINSYFPELMNADSTTLKKFWFYGLVPGMTKCNIFVSSIVSQTNYLIWSIKLRKEMLPLGAFIEDVNLSIYKMLKMSNKICEAKQNLDLFVCRHTFDPP